MQTLGAQAAESPCRNVVASPQIEFYSSYGKLNYDYTQGQHKITALAKKHDLLESGMFASGLAIAEIKWEVTLNSKGVLLSAKEACLVPAEVKLFIGYTDPTIYVANHLRKNSCEYDVVLRHEQTHQQINKTALEFFRPYFYKEIEKISKQVAPKYTNDLSQKNVNAATTLLTQEYITALTPMIETFKQELQIEHKKLDNPDNYRLEGILCK